MPKGRYGPPVQSTIWPGFTDALAGLVVALVFLLVLFLLFEVVLSRQVTGQEEAIRNLRNQVEHLAELLGTTQERRKELESKLRESRERRQVLQGQIAELENQRQELKRQLAQARQAQKRFKKDLARAREGRQETAERLAEARRAQEETEKRLIETRNEAQASQANLRALADYVGRLHQRLDRLRRVLDLQRESAVLAEARVERLQQEVREREEKVSQQRSRIKAMVARIRTELLRRVEVLERYRSEFFGRLRKVFADQPHIKIRGDRFVFQSQVLFPSGSAQLNSEGWDQLQRFVTVYRKLRDSIPKGLDMIIMVEGHTDRRPIQTPEFRSNWELSVARALAVVRFLIDQGISPKRLAATGYGEHHPLTPGNTPEQRRQNRRIELKITRL